MSRFILLAVLGLAAVGGNATAQCSDCGGGGGEKYGWHPLLKIKNWFGGKKGCDSGCKNCGGHGPRSGGYGAYTPPPGIGYPGTPGADMPGTLVFPNHPYARSPRDFFMYEPK